MLNTEGLLGTQSRQIPVVPTITPELPRIRKIKRVDSRVLNAEVNELRIGDVEVLLRELKRVVVALDEVGGFED